ncbi:MAG: hypothetical protein WKF47_16365 [Geodermatophilaceae bacterium]
MTASIATQYSPAALPVPSGPRTLAGLRGSLSGDAGAANDAPDAYLAALRSRTAGHR